jgi:hypothetical protein
MVRSAQPFELYAGRWSDDKGGCAVVQEGLTTVRIVMTGSVTGELALHVVDALTSLFARGKKWHLFWDLEELKAYESVVRVECTNVLLRHWPQVDSLHAFAVSKIVRMGVAVANLALRNRLVSHGERASFEAELEHALGSA